MKMKWRAYLLICSCLLLFGACDGSLFSVLLPTNIEFAKLEIHYTKSGGWIDTSQLNIYGNGLTSAHVSSARSSVPVESAAVMLTKKEQDHIARLFAWFSLYKPHYEPVRFWTDQDYHTIVFIYENMPDTVSVYDLNRAAVPGSLKKLIAELENLHDRIIRN